MFCLIYTDTTLHSHEPCSKNVLILSYTCGGNNQILQKMSVNWIREKLACLRGGFETKTMTWQFYRHNATEFVYQWIFKWVVAPIQWMGGTLAF